MHEYKTLKIYVCICMCVCGGGGLQKFLLLKRAGEQRGKGQTRRGTLSALFLLPSVV